MIDLSCFDVWVNYLFGCLLLCKTDACWVLFVTLLGYFTVAYCLCGVAWFLWVSFGVAYWKLVLLGFVMFVCLWACLLIRWVYTYCLLLLMQFVAYWRLFVSCSVITGSFDFG